MGVPQVALERFASRVVSVQAAQRLPSLVGAVADRSELIHLTVAGAADIGRGVAAGPEVQYRIGSITKTLTAVAVMQLVGEGKLDLEAPLTSGWADAPYPDIRIADLMAHASGIQREPVGRIWETLDFPSREELAKVARQGERLYPPGRYFHYSNMAFALLGELVARVGGGSWEQVVRKRILEPLGMRRTSLTPSAPMAEGYLVAPYSDEVVPEPPIDCGAIAPAGQLWSSATDLCRWSGALVGASPGVLSPELLDQMRAPRTISDLAHWRTGFGLGLMLLRDGDAIYQGHLGAMPGFLAAVLCHQASGMGVVLLTNCGAGIDLGGLAVELLGELRLAVPASTWSPGAAAPPAVAQLLGHWWSEGEEWTFRWKDQELQASPTRATPGELVTRFAHSGEDAFVAIDGRERGERMLVVRSPGGAVAKLYFATYPFTREWRSFGQGEQEA